MGSQRMIPFADAFAAVMEHARPLPAERVEFLDTPGRVLAEEVRSDLDFPPFNKATMDGFACRRADLGESLRIVETVPAGQVPRYPVHPGEATRIMTGAPVPEGADVVFMLEEARVDGERVRFVGAESGTNIAMRGEDVRAGEPVIPKGTLLAPRHVSVLASVGAVRPLVSCRPTVGIIATGDELVEPAERPGPGRIRNSNSAQLQAQAVRAGGIPRYYGIAGDREEVIRAALDKALAECDIVLLSGGVSMGDFDLVPDVLRQCGVTIHFDRVAVKPGKPVTFGTSPQGVVFGMPGNPVSTFVIFEIFVRPFVLAMMGALPRPYERVATLAAPARRRVADRYEFVPVSIHSDGTVEALTYHGSAHFLALSRAVALMAFPVGVLEMAAGTPVVVRKL